jgi:hypothetical protein
MDLDRRQVLARVERQRGAAVVVNAVALAGRSSSRQVTVPDPGKRPPPAV